MNTKKKYICLFLGVVSILLLGLTFFGDKINLNTLLKASVSENYNENNDVINAARKMALDNKDNLKAENVYTIRELIRNKYLTGDEIDPATNKEYDDNIRVVVKVKDNEIVDIYLTNVLFKNKIICDEVCYLNNDNYIYFNNDTYRILKINKQGNVFITKEDVKKVKKDNIENYLKNYKYSLNNSIVENVVSILDEDVEKSSFIELSDNTIVNTNTGYKKYNINTNSVEDITNEKINAFPIIVLKSEVTYEKGDGSKFNPYVLGE